jgi:hypothetical protein
MLANDRQIDVPQLRITDAGRWLPDRH